MNIDKKIKKMLADGLDAENKDFVLPCLNHLESKKQKINDIISNDYLKFNNDVYLISLATTLVYSFTNNGLIFSTQNEVDFSIKINDGKFFLPKKNGFNILYFEIAEKYKDKFEEIALLYKKLKPYLCKIREINYQKEIVDGNVLYKLYIKEEKYSSELIQFIKNNTINIEHIKEKIYDKTGWYYIEDDIFGKKDVDNNIVKGVILNGNWNPYSIDAHIISEEELFIIDNISLLNSYKIEKEKLRRKINEKDKILLDIKNEIINRNNMIRDLKIEIISQEKIHQKVI